MEKLTLEPRRNGSVDSSLAELVEALTAKLQAGEPVDWSAVSRDHPAHAGDLRALAPALAALADLSRSADRGPSGIAPPIDGGTPPGELGDFRIIREVGRGGMGVVYEAEQISLGRRVALKVLPFAATMDPKQLQRFHNEARAAASLHHEHIVPVYGVGCERSVHFYAMQFVEGTTLARIIAEMNRDLTAESAENAKKKDRSSPSAPSAVNSSPGDPTTAYRPLERASTTAPIAAASTLTAPRDKAFFRRVAELGIQAAEALEHAHSLGVVHRDVKPGNLMLDARGKLWVTDFGLARTAADAGLTMSGDLLGTLRYMSPEQAMARHGLVDHRTDIYALGATLYELLTGQPVVSGDDKQEILRQIAFEEPAAPRRVDPAIPADLETVLLKGLEKNPADRYTTAQELADDLKCWLEDRAIRAKPPRLRQKLAKRIRRHPLAVGIAAISMFAVVILVGFAFWFVERYGKEKGLREAAEGRATAQQRLTDTQTYHRLVSDVKSQIADPHPGWTWDCLAMLEEAAHMPVPEKNLQELRSLAAQCLGTVDARPAELLAKGSNLYAIAYHPSGRMIAVAEATTGLVDRSDVTLLDTNQPGSSHTLKCPPEFTYDKVHELAFSADGRWLVASTLNRIHCWDLSTQPPALASSKVHDATINCLILSPDSQTLFTASREHQRDRGVVKSWNLPTQIEAASSFEFALYRAGGNDGLIRLAVHPDEGWFVVSTSSYYYFLSMATLQPIRPPEASRGGRFEFSPDGRNWLVEGRYGIHEWSTPNAPWLVPDATNPNQWATAAAFSPDGALVALTRLDQVVIHDAVGGRVVADFPAVARAHREIRRMAFAPDGRKIAVTTSAGVQVYDIRVPMQQTSGPIFPDRVTDFVLAPNGRYHAFGSVLNERGTKSVTVFEAVGDIGQSFKPRYAWRARQDRGLAFDSASQRLARIGPFDINISHVDGSPKPTDRFSGFHSFRNGDETAFGADGNLWTTSRFVGFTVDQAGKSTFVSQQESRPVPKNPSSRTMAAYTSLAVGSRAAIRGTQDGMIDTFDPSNGNRLFSWEVAGCAISSTALSGDGRLAVVGTRYGEIGLVEISTGRIITTAEPFRSQVSTVAFAPGSRT